ncbi:MAG: cytochrome c [Flavobacteriales bacterium]|nr:cytochrome c [Flavobacteriales bacterium]
MTNVIYRIDWSDDFCHAQQTRAPTHETAEDLPRESDPFCRLCCNNCLRWRHRIDTSWRGWPPGAAAASEEAAPAGLITAAEITLGEIDQAMVEKGKATYDVKCQACHSTGPNRVVGPGWKGVTERRKPEWIMNMMLNIDVMLETDPEAQKGLEECLVRMPNQGLSKDQGREVLEFMRTL